MAVTVLTIIVTLMFVITIVVLIAALLCIYYEGKKNFDYRIKQLEEKIALDEQRQSSGKEQSE